MDNNLLKALLEKYNLGSITAEEKTLLESWYLSEAAAKGKAIHTADLIRANAETWEAVTQNTGLDQLPKKRTYKLWPRIGITAAIAAIAFGTWFYTARHLEGSEATRDLLNYANNDIPPGGNRATLTSNGKTINLSDAKTGIAVSNDIKYNDGTLIDPSALGLTDGDSRTLEVAALRGGIYSIILQDGTKAWLNADSKLKFESNYRNKLQRIVKLVGQAYFEVAKDAKRPFIVESKGQRTEVLGTHFDISAYPGEAIKTTLLEGSVRVAPLLSPPRGEKSAGQRGEVTLKPNQQAILTDNGIKRIQIDASDVIDWKNGEFIFKREPLVNIMSRVARWYNVDVIYDKKVDLNETFSGVVSRSKNISEVLNLMGLNGQLKFKIEGKKIFVNK